MGLIPAWVDTVRRRIGKALLRPELATLATHRDDLARDLAATRRDLATATAQLADTAQNLAAFEREHGRTAAPVRTLAHLEIALDAWDHDRAVDTLRRHGCLLVRGDAHTRQVVDGYRDLLNRIGYGRLSGARGGGLWQHQATPSYLQQVASVGITPEATPSDALTFPLHALVQQRLFALCATYHGTDLLASTVGGGFGSMRTVEPQPAPGRVPMHQDLSAVGERQSLTFWFAVDPDQVGTQAPGLRLVVSSKEGRPADIAPHDQTHSIADIRLRADECYWVPEVGIGDIIVFDPFVMHDSFVVPGMTHERTSVDFRIEPFVPLRANAYLTNAYGLVLFDAESMLLPRRLLALDAGRPEFAYGWLDDGAPSSRIVDAFDVAVRSPYDPEQRHHTDVPYARAW